MMNLRRYLLGCLLLPGSVYAADQADMEGITITGNKELPNILYVISWKSPELPPVADIPLASLIENALEPLDRRSVLREEQYYNATRNFTLNQTTPATNPDN
jgi:hypothetical protein